MTDVLDNDKTTARKKKYSAPALEKGLDILELLAKEPDGFTLSEVATRLNRSVGELFRMLVVLEQREYITLQSNTEKYVLTLKLFELSHNFPLVKMLTSVSMPVLKNLAHQIEQSCHLVIYYEGKGHVIAQHEAPSARICSVRLGAEAPLLGSCSGHLLLAFSDPIVQGWMLKKIPKQHKTLGKKEINEMMNRVKTQGYECMPSEQISGVQDLGCPIFDGTDQIVAVLAVPFVSYLDGSHPCDFNMGKEIVAAAAQDISVSLGYKK